MLRAVARRLAEPGPFDEAAFATGDASVPVAAPAVPATELIALAQARGYGNSFEAQSGQLPWRPVLTDGTGQRHHPRPTVAGPMTAIVVGPNGETTPRGADELHTDRYGRVKVRFHWQQGETDDDRSSCWIRVGQRQAGAGMGWQWLPRIGQEVLVTFLGNDIDRPVILGSLYNGRGEGGVTPTPGGAEATPADLSVFAAAADHSPAAQGNLTGGQSPAWHGAAADGHRQAAALTGFKSKEFGGSGYSQLVLDDSDGQQRVQLKTTQHASELNLGHLIHQADNYRGSFRGTGAELRTDAWGALRAGRGIVMTTWPGTAAQPAGDLAPGIALLKQATTLAGSLSQAAACHQTVQLAAAVGSIGPKQSVLDPKAAPIQALATTASGMVDAKDPDQAAQDAQAKETQVKPGKLPHLTDAAIVQAAKGGLGLVAGQAIQYTGGETVSFLSGGDSNLAVAGKARIHAGQAIGLLAGAVRPGEGNTGIHLVAARDDVTFQAQSDVMKLQAKNDVKLVSVAAGIDFAAAKKIVFEVAGGASITIDGGISVKAPRTITVQASSKSFGGPASMHFDAPKFMQPDGYHLQPVLHWDGTDDPVVNRKFRATLEDGRVVEGVTDAQGHAQIAETTHFQIAHFDVLPKES
jgi:type VI secretion system secreted protein VgrG